MPPPGVFMPATSVPNRSAGRSSSSNNVATPSSTASSIAAAASSIPAQLTLSTRGLNNKSRVFGTRDATASPTSPMSHPRRPFNPKQVLKTDMSQSNSGSKISAVPSASGEKQHHKLHKRGPPQNSSSLPSQTESHIPFTTPFATYDQSIPDVPSSSPISSSVPKIKPYLRKMSSAKEDQGMIDLSKSTRDNDRLAGLGIQEFGPKTIADVNFTHSKRGQHHGRNVSNGSNNSSGSGNFRATQAFVHPMAKTPRPYTPPSGLSYANSLNEEEANESDDVVEDDFRMGNGFRSRRSTSVSSTPQMIPTPLSQSHTASDLGLIPKLTSTSQSNLSLASNYSDKSSNKKARPRRNTDLSQEYIPSPTSRTSFDRAFSLVGRKSEAAEPQSREDIILAARRKFEEKEANKDRKYEKAAEAKRQRKQSDAPPLKSALKQQVPERRRRKSSAAKAGAENEKLRGMSYEDHRPAHSASLPTFGTKPGESEKAAPRLEQRQQRQKEGNWMRFSTWFQTRMLSCGGSRA